MPSGGKRIGAGRKVASHTLDAEIYRAELIKQIVANKTPLAKALVDKALGGDVPALKEINDRGLGKAAQSLDLTSGGKPIGHILDEIEQENERPKTNR
jgi:hypothetical protein